MSEVAKPSFVFVVCQVGAEPALKKELGHKHPELKFAYSRPGFVTFKSEKPLSPDFQLRTFFGRAFGLSVTKWTEKDLNHSDLAKKLFGSLGEGSACLHVWERDRHPPGEEPMGFEAGEWTATAIEAIQNEAVHHPGIEVRINEPAVAGERVFDLVLIEEKEWWFGTHIQGLGHSPFPGGRPSISLPAEAPSRAYLKLEEGLLWSGVPIRAGDVAVEVGSAPGGASYALLQRGLYVVGIDPGEMDPRLLRSKMFQHIQSPIAGVHREDLPQSVQWLLVDMNVAPNVSLFAVDRLATAMKDSLLGLLLTIKLNQWSLADQIPSMLAHIKSMGMVRAKATQLPSNRQEIFIYGVTRKGSTRPN